MTDLTISAVCVLAIIFAFALFKGWMDSRAQARRERVGLLEEALGNPDIDRETLETLTYQLTGVRSPGQGGATPRWMGLILVAGWLGLFAGIGIGLFGYVGVSAHDEMMADTFKGTGVIVGFLGFGVLTLPFAIRELEARSTAQ